MRRLLLLISAIVLVDTMLFAAIAPLLPRYSDDLGLSKTAAGVLVAAYPAGTLLGSLPAGWLATRWGVKPTVLLGLGGLALSSLAFGFAEEIALLDAARFVQGLSSAASWSAGLSWLVRAAPRERRGELIGTAFSAAIGGALLGPALGAAAVETSTEVVFGLVALAAVILFGWAAREPAPGPSEAGAGVRRALRNPAVLAGLSAVVLVGIFFGVLDVLVPLRLDELGAGAVAIGVTFVCTSGLQAITSRALGRLSDRRGALAPLRAGLCSAAAIALLLPLFDSPWLVAAAMVTAGPSVGALWVPGLSLLSDGAEAAGVDQAIGFGLMNMAWAGSQSLGASGGGSAAEAFGDAAVYGALTAVMAGALLVFLLRPPAAARR